ncbi:MAG: hypothetical protein DVS81_02790 [Candidatus Accumulibacter meliphilus]|jgi:hypothetical protein|uniref:Uncharacterized protein n=1 Tax=Candidatus Accumulibacter meliphilus TaxID=2211374 RepID=A0A369XQB4_9PROT|nr:MAG: hypothetical protein DVS81_02790 [Candidatus Accumulibacter meliphilus]
MTALFVANRSSVLIDGVAVEGLQSLVYRVVTEREDIRAVGSGERVDVSFGLRSVQGELVIKSANYVLDAHLAGQSSFQVVANLKKDPATDAPRRTLSFDDCYVEGKSFGMDAGGSAVTTYAFSATRIREE